MLLKTLENNFWQGNEFNLWTWFNLVVSCLSAKINISEWLFWAETSNNQKYLCVYKVM